MDTLKSKYMAGLIGIVLIAAFIFFAFFSTFYRSKQITGILIADNVDRLADIFERIHDTCGILSFDFDKNPINFLNVKEFVGSEVGPMNLIDPEKWEGPYIPDNPTVHDKEFQIIKTKDGYFITPGDGVTLPNGKEVGKDVMITHDSDIPAMMQDDSSLLFEGKALAVPINVGQRTVEDTPEPESELTNIYL